MAFGIAGAVAGGGALGRVAVELVGDSSRLRKDVARARKDVGTGTVAMEKRAAAMATAWKTAGLVAGAALVAFGISAVKAFKEAQVVMAQTEAVLKSTGGAANVTAEDVSALASKLRDLSGVDDEVIQSGENMLLTFTKIRNEVGEGNDIFNQATEAVLDMSVAMGRDMQSTAIQVGKALQDPILGMTALRRVGVNFNKEQANVVKNLVETGRHMEAQKFILRELTTEFGGSAKAAGQTFAGKLNILKSQFGDLQEAVGGFIVGGLSPLIGGFNKLPGPIKGVVAGVIGLTLVMVALAAVVKTVRNSLGQLGLAQGMAGAGFVAMASKAAILPAILMTIGAGLGSLVRNLTNTVTAEQALISVTGQLEAAVLSGQFTWAEIKGAVDEYNQTIGALPGAQQLSIDSFRNLAGGVGELPPALAGAGEAVDDWKQETSESLRSVSGVLGELAGKANLTADQIIKAFIKQAAAVAKYEKNMATLVAAGAPDALLKQISALGLQGAPLLAAIASSSKRDMDRVFSAFDRASGGVSLFVGKLNALDGRHVRVFIDTFTGDLPTHAKGFHGVVSGAYPFIAGEAGPERVDITPLNQLRKGMQAPAGQWATGPAVAGGDNYFNVNILVDDVSTFEDKLERGLNRVVSRFGAV